MSNHLKGLLITALGIIALSPDSLIIRLLEADQSTILFWRGLFVFEGMLLVTSIIYGRDTIKAFKKIGSPGIGAAVMWTLSTFCFISALLNTSVANALVIISTSPVFAALLSRFFLKEPIAIHTMAAIVVVIGAVALIVSSSYESGNFLGDMYALGTAVFVAGTFVFTRQKKNCDMTPAVAISGLMVAAVALPFASPFEITQQTEMLFLLLGAVMTVALGLLFIGPRYIPAAEVSLMLPLETVLGTLIVWWALGEEPTTTTMLGGTIVVVTLIIHSAIALRQEKLTAAT